MSKRLPELVKAAFHKSKAANDLNYYPTQVVDLSVASVPFQLRFSPALAHKPKAPAKESSSPSAKALDPFAYSPLPKLFISDWGNSHFLVLNKFAVTEEHFILATKEFRPQTAVLELGDLESALACVKEYVDHGGLYVFFNCGEHSGASQPHRHLQLLPISQMRDGLDKGSPWRILASNLGPNVPFRTFSERIHVDMNAKDLFEVYLRLYRKACEVSGVQEYMEDNGDAKISYNLAMTEDSLVLCPRVADGKMVVDENGHEVGKLSLNGTMLAGTALVKSEAEWLALKDDPAALTTILSGVGLPKV